MFFLACLDEMLLELDVWINITSPDDCTLSLSCHGQPAAFDLGDSARCDLPSAEALNLLAVRKPVIILGAQAHKSHLSRHITVSDDVT